MQSTEKVRKQFLLDPGKIQVVKRITHASTDTEAINRALDMVIANEKIQKALASVKGKGKIEDVFGRVSA
jgi:guanylate kinase